MEEQSGFFASAQMVPQSFSPELMHASGSGITLLYKTKEGGRMRLLKVLAPQFRGDPLYEGLLKKEFEIGFSLSHPSIREFYSFRQYPSLGSAIEMEWVEGDSLEDLIRGRYSLPLEMKRKIILETIDALSYMHHRQVIHRDLKPQNIMVTSNGANVKIIDLGFSDTDSHYALKTAAGTRRYASPELLEGGEVTQSTDIYSFGVIMGEMGMYPKVAARCCQSSPFRRPATMEEVKSEILRYERFQKWSRVVLIAAIILLVGVGVMLFTSRSRGKGFVDGVFEQTQQLIRDKI